MPRDLAATPKARPVILGHRGASADAPENTLAAFRLAVEQGADGVELDVWRCGSGEVVVHHDLDTQRTAGERRRVTTSSYASLRRLDVGAWKGSRFRGEPIPLLAEALEAVPGIVNVELKSSGVPDLALAVAVARVLRDARAAERSIVSSFDCALLAAFRVAAPGVRTGLLFAADQAWRLREAVGTRLLRPRAVHPEWMLVSEERVRAWRARGLAVNVWTVDDAAEVRRLCRLGVAGLVTNRPAATLAAVRAARGA